MINLNDDEYKLLKLIYKRKRTYSFLLQRLRIDKMELQSLVNGQLVEFIVCTTNSEDWTQGTVAIKPVGKALWEERHRLDSRHRVTRAISIIALAISLLALLYSIGLIPHLSLW